MILTLFNKNLTLENGTEIQFQVFFLARIKDTFSGKYLQGKVSVNRIKKFKSSEIFRLKVTRSQIQNAVEIKRNRVLIHQ